LRVALDFGRLVRKRAGGPFARVAAADGQASRVRDDDLGLLVEDQREVVVGSVLHVDDVAGSLALVDDRQEPRVGVRPTGSVLDARAFGREVEDLRHVIGSRREGPFGGHLPRSVLDFEAEVVFRRRGKARQGDARGFAFRNRLRRRRPGRPRSVREPVDDRGLAHIVAVVCQGRRDRRRMAPDMGDDRAGRGGLHWHGVDERIGPGRPRRVFGEESVAEAPAHNAVDPRGKDIPLGEGAERDAVRPVGDGVGSLVGYVPHQCHRRGDRSVAADLADDAHRAGGRHHDVCRRQRDDRDGVEEDVVARRGLRRGGGVGVVADVDAQVVGLGFVVPVAVRSALVDRRRRHSVGRPRHAGKVAVREAAGGRVRVVVAVGREEGGVREDALARDRSLHARVGRRADVDVAEGVAVDDRVPDVDIAVGDVAVDSVAVVARDRAGVEQQGAEDNVDRALVVSGAVAGVSGHADIQFSDQAMSHFQPAAVHADGAGVEGGTGGVVAVAAEDAPVQTRRHGRRTSDKREGAAESGVSARGVA